MAKVKRGLACLSPEKRSAIARLGGKAVQAGGNAHKFTSETARKAGIAAQATGRAHQFTQAEARRAGRIGGRNRWYAGLATALAAAKAADEGMASESSPPAPPHPEPTATPPAAS